MSGFAGIDNSIGWAHWRLRGGWKSVLGTACAYGLGLIGLIFLTIRANPSRASSTLQGWNLGFIWIQAAVLVLFAGSRVSNAIRSDLTSRMIESHRLMPVPPLSAISGYLWGATSQAMIFCAITFVIGCFVTIGAGIQLKLWVAVNLLLIGFALFVWVISAFAAFMGKGASALVGFSLFLVSISAGNGALLTPGLMVMLSPMIGKTIFVTRLANADVTWPLMTSLMAQVYVGAIFYYGASRKYRRTEETALGVIPAILLLAGWVAMSAIALNWWEDFFPSPFQRNVERPVFLMHSTTISSVILALIAVANAARDRKTRRIAPLVALLCAILAALTSLVPMDESTPAHAVELTALAAGATLVGVCFLLQIVYRVTDRGWVIAVIWLLVSWVGPIMVDFARWQLDTALVDFEPTGISAVSMPGALLMLWNRGDQRELMIGLVIQWALALGWGLVALLTARRRRKVVNA